MFKVNNIKPLFTKIVTTADLYTEDKTENGLILKTKGTLKEYQKVLRVGDAVRNIKEGDIILLDFTKYMVKDKKSPDSLRDDFIESTYHLEIPQAIMADNDVLIIDSSSVVYIVEGEEIKEDNTIILPKKNKIIM